MDVVHLVETEHNLDSSVRLEELMLECKKQNMKDVIIANHHKLYHLVDAELFSRKYNVRVINGCRFQVNINGEIFEMVLIAKTDKGLNHLSSLSSVAHKKEGLTPFITSLELNQYKEGIIPILTFKGSSNEELQHYGKVIKGLQEIFGREDVYLELHLSSSKDLTNAKAVKWLSRNFGVKMFASNRVSYLKKEDAIVREIRRCIRNNEVLNETYSDQRYLKSYDEMKKVYGHYDGSIENGVEIARKVTARVILKGDVNFKPKPLEFDVPQTVKIPKNLQAYFTPIKNYTLPSDEKNLRAIAYLCELALDGFKKFYDTNNVVARERIKYELGVIIGQNFTHYFLIVWDFIRYCKENHIQRIPVGPGRGSSAGSMLARCLNITEIDPLEFGLFFERFLNPERITMPDIDIDLSNELRYLVIQYAKKKYGERSVAQIVTFGKFGSSNSIRNVRKALQYNEEFETKILKLIPQKTSDLVTLVKRPEGKDLLELSKKDEDVRKVLSIASKLEHLVSHTSTNAAGLIITSGDIAHQIPVTEERDIHGGVAYLTQIPNNEQQMELLGYTKIDFLGLKNVDIPYKTEQWIKKNHGIEDIKIPIDDSKTYELYQSGHLTGVFQMDSQGMQNTCRTIKPSNILELMDILALYRPGPMEEIKTYAENKKNKVRNLANSDQFSYEDIEDLEPVLSQTYGIMVYQEQVIMIANVWAGFTLGQADILRQAISKKDMNKLTEEKEKFMHMSLEKGRDPKTTEAIFALILKFANYGFNKSHAAVYAHQSFTNAYYKTHFPIEYMATRISASMDKTDTAAKYVIEAIRMGIHIEKPNIHTSEDEFIPIKDGIIFGLPMIKDVGKKAVSFILTERKKAPFHSFENFLSRMDSSAVNKKTIAALVKVGAFDSFGTRKKLLERLEGKEDSFDFGVFRFDEFEWLGLSTVEENIDFDNETKRGYERRYLGFPITDHPLLSRKEEMEKLIASKPYGQWIYGSIAQIRKKRDRNENEMADIIFEKVDGSMTLVVFKNLWKKIKGSVKKGDVLICRITPENEKKAILNEMEII